MTDIDHAELLAVVTRACRIEMAANHAEAITADELAATVCDHFVKRIEGGLEVRNLFWLARSEARRTLWTHQARRRRLTTLTSDSESGGDDRPRLDLYRGVIDAGADHHVTALAIAEAVAKLDEVDRLIMRETLDGKTPEQIAALFGTSAKIIKARVQKAGRKVLADVEAAS